MINLYVKLRKGYFGTLPNEPQPLVPLREMVGMTSFAKIPLATACLETKATTGSGGGLSTL